MHAENRVKRFRRVNGLTQEMLAERWGVTVRSVGRWERGEGRPAEWMRREMNLVGSPLEWPSTAALRQLVERQVGPAMIFDVDFKVLVASEFHRNWGLKTYGVDFIGADWNRYLADHAKQLIERHGSLRRMIHNGLMCMRGIYQDPGGSPGGDIPLQLFADFTVVRVPDFGAISIAVGRPARADDNQNLFAPYFMD